MTLFAEVGRVLYGEGKNIARVTLSAKLDVDYRTIERWWSGDMHPPPRVWAELAELLREHQGALLLRCLEQAEQPKNNP